MKRRALVVSPMVPHPEAHNAGPVVMHGVIRALRNEYDVTLATLADFSTAEGDLVRDLIRSGLDVRYVQRRPFGGWRGRLRVFDMNTRWRLGWYPQRTLIFHEPAFQRLLTRTFRRERFDVLQIEDNSMMQYRYPKRLSAILTEHEPRSDEDVRAEVEVAGRHEILADEQARWRRYQHMAYNRVEAVQVFTPRDEQFVRTIANNAARRIVCNPFGITIPDLDEATEEDPSSIVFVGGFLHPPNVVAARWLAGELMPVLRRRAVSAHLTIIGSHPPESVRALSAPDIRVTGYVPLLAPFLRAAAVVLAPVWNGRGMRHKVLDAMAWGKAVVASPLGAEGVPIATPPVIAVAADAESFADRVAALLRAPEERRRMGAAARALAVKHFSWDAFGRRLLALHADVLQNRDAT